MIRATYTVKFPIRSTRRVSNTTRVNVVRDTIEEAYEEVIKHRKVGSYGTFSDVEFINDEDLLAWLRAGVNSGLAKPEVLKVIPAAEVNAFAPAD